jgi:type IV secretory pathway VirB10-like protein
MMMAFYGEGFVGMQKPHPTVVWPFAPVESSREMEWQSVFQTNCINVPSRTQFTLKGGSKGLYLVSFRQRAAQPSASQTPGSETIMPLPPQGPSPQLPPRPKQGQNPMSQPEPPQAPLPTPQEFTPPPPSKPQETQKSEPQSALQQANPSTTTGGSEPSKSGRPMSRKTKPKCLMCVKFAEKFFIGPRGVKLYFCGPACCDRYKDATEEYEKRFADLLPSR